MVGLHEVDLVDNLLWVSATTIDAALQFNISTGKLIREAWPRDWGSLQTSLSLRSSNIDRTIDNRACYLGNEHIDDLSHLHLNAIAQHAGRTFALFNKHGAIADLDLKRIIIQHPNLKGAHNLKFVDDNVVLVNDTTRRNILRVNLDSGKVEIFVNLDKFQHIRWIHIRHTPKYITKKIKDRLGLQTRYFGRPVFLRGLACTEDRVYVGISPATILEIDRASGNLLDYFQYSSDVNACIHGLAVDQN